MNGFDTAEAFVAIGTDFQPACVEITIVGKAEWGTKRTCHNCGSRFYDLNRNPIVCPVCETVFEPERTIRPRRGAKAVAQPVDLVEEPPVKEAAEEEPVEAEVAIDETEDPEAAEGTDLEEEIDSEDEDLIEDASDLGEDDDDIGEVMEHMDSDLDDKA